MLDVVAVIRDAGGRILYGDVTDLFAARRNDLCQRRVVGAVDRILVAFAFDGFQVVEGIHRFQIVIAGERPDVLGRTAYHVAQQHLAVFDLALVVIAHKTAGAALLFQVCIAVGGIGCAARKDVVTLIDAGDGGVVYLGAVGFDEVDRYVGILVAD